MTNDAHRQFDFDRETRADKTGENQWQLTLAPDWNISGNPNGGYLLGCLLRSMASLLPGHPDPVSVTTHYLRPGVPQKQAVLNADIVRAGRRTATMTGTLLQDGKPRIITTATFSNLASPHDLKNPESPNRSQTIAAPDLPSPDQCVDRMHLAQGVDLAILSRVDVRVDPQYQTPGKSAEAAMAGWIRFADERPADILALPLFCDAFPPSIFSLYGTIGWVPTVELGVHIRQRPAPGWIKAQFSTRDIAGDLFIEDGLLWDESDQLVAQSRQLQMILPAA